MGIIAKRPRVHLDSDVVAGLVRDQTARDHVTEAKRNGGLILLSPAVVRELAHARKEIRDRLVRAALEYCDGFTSLQAPEILQLEINGIIRAEEVPPIPILPIEELRRLLVEREAIKILGDLRPGREKRDDIDSLIGVRRALTGHVEDDFEAFLESWMGDLFRQIVDTGVKAGVIPVPQLPADGRRAHHDKYALAGAVALIAANMYRQSKGIALKGEGCLSDLRNIIEVAHADLLLTRDKELSACAVLVRSVITDARPRVSLVPQPT